ncbi:carboxypeptidase-like regulatory domain-containing protein [Mucilaginibacter ximonensis]|uniref:Carboxypeptidase-like regulatory domain-containing protein n=1 Tax=Mucilaginibacter ximonensis TaxID=538021 RepID=A0ABW5YAJ5_9SPHI
MKINLYSLFFLLCLMIVGVQPANSQTIFEGQVLDKTTDLPIPAVTVTLLKKHIIVLSNDQGYFKIIVDGVLPEDELIFTSIGYETYKLPVKMYTSDSYIKMQPTNTLLNQVNVKAGKLKQMTIDKFLVPNINPFETKATGVMAISNTLEAKLFNIPTKDATLKSVQFGRRDYGDHFITTNKFARFKLHIMNVDTITGAPGKTIFTKDVNLQDNSHIVSIDLSKDKIVLPSTRFFIAIEHLFIPYNEVVSIEASKKVAGTDKKGDQVLEDTPLYYVEYQPFLATYPQNHPIMFWYKKDQYSSWLSRSIAANNDTMTLSVTILY